MKSCIKIIVVTLVTLLGSTWTNIVQAGDSGDERTIAVTEWQCWNCNKQFFTFAPDDIEGKNSAPQNYKPEYQRANWLQLKDKSSIRKCEKSNDGAHAFDKKRDLMTSGFIIRANLEKYIVLKNGSSLKTKIQAIECANCDCKMKGVAFDGDDLDLWDRLVLSDPVNVFNLQSGSKIPDCKGEMVTGKPIKVHIFKHTGKNDYKSLRIADELQYFWYSD